MIAGLGVCLSDLVVSQPSGTTDAPPLPSVSGLNNPTVITTSSNRLTWWQILLMALGCAFILIIVIWLFRRHQRKKRAKRAAQFGNGLNAKKERTGWQWKLLRFFGGKLFCHGRGKRAAQLDKGFSDMKEETGWRWKLIRFGEKLFGHAPSRRVPIVRVEAENFKLTQLRMMEEARPIASFATDFNNNSMDHSEEGGREEQDMVHLIESYNPLPETYYVNRHVRVHVDDHRSLLSDSTSQHSAPSMYSQVTGLPHNVPEPRQPLKSRFSMSTFATNEVRKNNHSGKKAFWK